MSGTCESLTAPQNMQVRLMSGILRVHAPSQKTNHQSYSEIILSLFRFSLKDGRFEGNHGPTPIVEGVTVTRLEHPQGIGSLKGT